MEQRNKEKIAREIEWQRRKHKDANDKSWLVQSNSAKDVDVMKLQNSSQHTAYSQTEVFKLGEKINPDKVFSIRYYCNIYLSEIRDKFKKQLLINISKKDIKKTTKQLDKLFNRFEKEIKLSVALGFGLINSELTSKLKTIKDNKIKIKNIYEVLNNLLESYHLRMVIHSDYCITKEEYKKINEFGGNELNIVNIWKKMDSSETKIFENKQKMHIKRSIIDFLQSLRSKVKSSCKYPPSQYNYKASQLILLYNNFKKLSKKIVENEEKISSFKKSKIKMEKVITDKETENQKLKLAVNDIYSKILSFYWTLIDPHFSEVNNILFDNEVDISDIKLEHSNFESSISFSIELENRFSNISNYEELSLEYTKVIKLFIGKPIFYEAYQWLKDYKESRVNVYEDQLESGEIGQYLLGFQKDIKLEPEQIEFYNEMRNLYDTPDIFKTIIVAWPTGLGKSWLSNMLPVMYPNKRILYVLPNDLLTFDCSQQQNKNQRGVDIVGCIMEAGRFPRFDKNGEVLKDYIDQITSQRVTAVTAKRYHRYSEYLDNYDIIILDEGHCAKDYSAYTSIMKKYDKSHVIVLSATINIDEETEAWFNHIRPNNKIIFNRRTQRPIPLTYMIAQQTSEEESKNSFDLVQLSPLLRFDMRSIPEDMSRDINYSASDKNYLQLYRVLNSIRQITENDSYPDRNGVTRNIRMDLFFEGMSSLSLADVDEAFYCLVGWIFYTEYENKESIIEQIYDTLKPEFKEKYNIPPKELLNFLKEKKWYPAASFFTNIKEMSEYASILERDLVKPAFRKRDQMFNDEMKEKAKNEKKVKIEESKMSKKAKKELDNSKRDNSDIYNSYVIPHEFKLGPNPPSRNEIIRMQELLGHKYRPPLNKKSDPNSNLVWQLLELGIAYFPDNLMMLAYQEGIRKFIDEGRIYLVICARNMIMV